MGAELPIYIPAEFLYSDRVQLYLGISSSAIANVRGGQAISLLELISFKDESVRERFKQRLVQTSRTKILFPSSLDELERMIISITGRKR